MDLDDVLSILTLVACVVAVFLARRGARRKMGEAYARGARDVSSRSSVAVHVGDYTVHGGGIGAGRAVGHAGLTAGIDDDDDGAGIDDDDDDHYVAGRVTMRRPDNGQRVGELPDVGVRPAIGELHGGGALAGLPSARRPSRSVRLARSRVTAETAEVISDDDR